MSEMFDVALKHLSTRRISISELKSLLEKDFSSTPNVDELVEKTINRLKGLNLINDSYIASNQAQRYQHKGNRFIIQKLQQKGIDEESIDNAIESLPSEFERALPEARKKLRSIHNLEAKSKENKLLQFLSSRAFSANTCYQVIDELKEDFTT